MDSAKIEITETQLDAQRAITEKMRRHNDSMPRRPLAFVDTYGCQQNEADSEKISGMLYEMGYAFTDDENRADLVIINSCAVREHAETR